MIIANQGKEGNDKSHNLQNLDDSLSLRSKYYIEIIESLTINELKRFDKTSMKR